MLGLLSPLCSPSTSSLQLQHKQFAGPAAVAPVPSALPITGDLTTPIVSPVPAIGLTASPANLRAQLQPFTAYTPQQVQEQLQQLRFNDDQPPVAGLPDAAVMEVGTSYTVMDRDEVESAGGLGGGADTGTGGDSDGSGDVCNSRKTSASSRGSLLSQLLSPASSDTPLGQKELPGSTLHPPGGGVAPSYPNGHLHPPPYRRHSLDDNASASYPPKRQQRNTLPELFPQHNYLLDRVAMSGGQFPPSFPLQMEGSPTKAVTSHGRRSPIPDQMDSIAEDATEDSGDVPSTSRTSSSSSLRYGPPSPGQQGGRSGRTTPQDMRQRRTGVILNSSALHKELAAMASRQQQQQTSAGTNNITSSNSSSSSLVDALKSPLPAPHTSPSSPSPPQLHHSHLHPGPNAHPPQVYPGNHVMNCFNALQPLAPPTSGSIADVLAHVQTVLLMHGIAFHHRDGGVFEVEHQGVRLQILVGTARLPNLASQSAIQLQYLAGDTAHYQTLCNHLAMQLQLSV